MSKSINRTLAVIVFSALILVIGVLADAIELLDRFYPGIDNYTLLEITIVVGLLILIGSLLLWSTENFALPSLCKPDFSKELVVSKSSADTMEDLFNIAKASVTLILIDQTSSGIWSWSYLYRRIISKVEIPVAYGTLTSIPQSVFGIFSLIQRDDKDFIRFCTANINSTLNKSINASNGQYLKHFTIGQGGKVPQFEPPRHTAGGLLGKILLGEVSKLDKMTLSYLLELKSPHGAWDKAIIARTLTHVMYDRSFSWLERIQAWLHRNRLIDQLIQDAKGVEHDWLIWSYSYNYGRDATNQWDSIWALYPLLSDKFLFRKRRKNLMLILKRLVESYITAAPNTTSMLPAKIDLQSFKGLDEYTFSTTLAPLLSKVFEKYFPEEIHFDEMNLQSTKSLNRVIANYDKIIKNPSIPIDNEPNNIEGFYAWAGMCVTASGFGARLDPITTAAIRKFVEEVRKITPGKGTSKVSIDKQVEDCLTKFNDLFGNKYKASVKEAIVNLLFYRGRVLEEQA